MKTKSLIIISLLVAFVSCKKQTEPDSTEVDIQNEAASDNKIYTMSTIDINSILLTKKAYKDSLQIGFSFQDSKRIDHRLVESTLIENGDFQAVVFHLTQVGENSGIQEYYSKNFLLKNLKDRIRVYYWIDGDSVLREIEPCFVSALGKHRFENINLGYFQIEEFCADKILIPRDSGNGGVLDIR